ncbi:hypothetical protein [Haloferula sp.]|uniref:hypothetical protein n=1 Tax=Haloferula sp. TaxID=2497595 RepID=UPI00329EFFC5
MKSFCLILLLAIAQVAQAETIESLLAAGELEARALVKTPTPHFQKAPIEIVVEVGTPDHFSRVTRVRDFTVPGTLIRRTTKSAFNETRRRDGDSWDFQSVRFELHSERDGRLIIPALTSFISIETEADGVVEGELKLTVPPLEIEIPPGTEDLSSWVAADVFTVEETWEGVLENYEIGDAVTRVRSFTISGSPAMAIPASAPIKLNGVDVYEAPVLVDDEEVGGALQGVREERVVFTFKGGGTHTIPDQSIHWFNLKTKAVETIDLPGRALEVSGPPVAAAAAEPESEPRGDTKGLWYGVLAVVGLALGYFLFRRIGRPSWIGRVRARLESSRRHRDARADFMRAAEQQDSRRCLELLYRRMSEHSEWQLSAACANDPQLSAAADALMAHAYDGGLPPQASEVQRLWDLCEAPKEKQESPDALQLNPGPSR